METPFTIEKSDDLTYTTMPGGSFSGSDKLIYDIKKTKTIRIQRNDENSLHITIVNEDGNERSGYIRAKDKNETGRRKLEAVEADTNDLLGVSYYSLLHRQFILKPKTLQISVSETIRVRTELKGKVREGQPGEVAAHFEFLEREDTTADRRFPTRDVNVSVAIDHRNDKYDKVVKDIKTGEIIHEKHKPLSQHISERDKKRK